MDVEATPAVCSSCGTVNEAGRKFCKECGEALSVLCPSCSSANAADSKFCGECGTRLSGGSPAVAAAAPSTERRLVSVLFADLVGFTTLSEHRDAEDVRDLLSGYFDAARQVIERHGGLVEKFIGDAVMAVWGTPIAYEDDAERAVRAGLELVDAVANLGRDMAIDLAARAGVLTGEAATTEGGLAEGIVVGDMVNTASRLQSAAEPGTVLVGDATYRAASKAVAFADAGDLTLKGKDEPVHAWRAMRVVGERGGTGVTGLEPPFVGRADELRLVKDLLHATEREGKARLVSVTGIGGIGKSRLAWEFRKYVDGLADDIYWHQGRCPAYGDGVTFWALGEMVRMRAGIAETDDAETSSAKLKGTIEHYVPDPEERLWLSPRLAHLLGLEDQPAGERDELFSAWRTFFDRIVDLGPLVMVFEDLQWADPGLLDFIESTLEWSRDRPILIVTLARPELFDRRATWGTNQRSFTALRLEPLPASAMSEMVAGFVPGLADADVERIVSRAEGIPLYAVETVRMLADRGALEPRGEGYAVVGDVGDLEVPETLHALIAARLDGLSAELRALLQDAAVLGKSFTPEGLAAVSGEVPAATEERMRELVRKEFLIHDADPRSPERGQYGFRQSLIREVAHSTLSKAERRRRHLAAAHFVETLNDDELRGVVAAHYVEAYRATPEGPDAQALAARARDWLGQAADRARSLGSPEQALVYAEQALEITPTGPERALLLERAGDAADKAGRQDPSVSFYDEAIALWREQGDMEGVARATAAECQPLLFLIRRTDMVERCEAALRDLPSEDMPVAAALFEQLATARIFMGEPVQGLAMAEKGLVLAERFGLDDAFATLLARKSIALFSLSRHREAVVLAHGVVAAAEQLSDHYARCTALMNLGVLSTEESPKLALEAFLAAAEEARKAGSRVDEAMGLANAMESAIDLGEFDQADQIQSRLGDHPIPDANRAAFALDRALLAAHRGEHALATSELDAIAAQMMDPGILPLRTWYLRTRMSAELLAGHLDAALEGARAALEPDPTGMNAPNAVWGGVQAALWSGDVEGVKEMVVAAEPLRGRWIDAVRTTAEAGLAALGGHSTESSEGFARALEAWEALGLPLDYAQCVVDAVTVLPHDQVPAEAVARARETFTKLRAAPLLDRLETAVATHAAS